jgi:hypothetical protein
MVLLHKCFVFDLNSPQQYGQITSVRTQEDIHEFRTNGFSSASSVSATSRFQPVCAALSGLLQIQSFSTFDQFLCLAYAQMSGRQSLRDIETCLNSHSEKLYHIGFRGGISRSTLADANERRDWRIFEDFGHVLIRMAQNLYCNKPFALELDQPLFAFDSTIDLCLSLFPWAQFRSTKAGGKNAYAAKKSYRFRKVLFLHWQIHRRRHRKLKPGPLPGKGFL